MFRQQMWLRGQRRGRWLAHDGFQNPGNQACGGATLEDANANRQVQEAVFEALRLQVAAQGNHRLGRRTRKSAPTRTKRWPFRLMDASSRMGWISQLSPTV